MKYDCDYKSSKHFQEKRNHVRNIVFSNLMICQSKMWIKKCKPIEYDGTIFLTKKDFENKFKTSGPTLKKALQQGTFRGKPISYVEKTKEIEQMIIDNFKKKGSIL